MFAVLTLALALQSVQVRIGDSSEKAKADSARRQVVRDSAQYESREREIDRERSAPRRIPLTAELERTAFRDREARTLLLRARDARMQQDSSLTAYDASYLWLAAVPLGYAQLLTGILGAMIAYQMLDVASGALVTVIAQRESATGKLSALWEMMETGAATAK